MSTRKIRQIRFRQRAKRHMKRLELLQKGLDPNNFFCGKYYIGQKQAQ